MTINKRVRTIRSSLKMNQTEFGSRVDVAQNYLSSIEKGHKEVTEKIIKLISFEYKVNETWLRTGEGEMFVQSETFSFDEQVKKSNLTELETAIMRGYMELSRDTREEIVSMLEGIILQRNESESAAAIAERNIDDEVESYRRQLEAEQKGATLSASHAQKGKSS